MGHESDWTLGPAKWIAVGVLSAASIAGMTWTIAQKYPTTRDVAYLPAAEPQEPARPPVQREVLAIQDERLDEEPDRTGDLLEELAGHPRATAVEAPELEPVPEESASEARPPVESASPGEPPPRERRLTYTRIINVNAAPAAELELLPGIGPSLAGRIVEYRQAYGYFRTVEELANVPGIGPKTVERLRPRVKLE